MAALCHAWHYIVALLQMVFTLWTGIRATVAMTSLIDSVHMHMPTVGKAELCHMHPVVHPVLKHAVANIGTKHTAFDGDMPCCVQLN